MKAYKVTISGAYRKAKREIVNFDGLSGIVPFTDSDIMYMHLRSRYAPMWLTKDKRFKDRVSTMREVYVDSVEEVEHEFTFVGKDIREMSEEELQDLATAFDLRRIPLYRKSSLRETRVHAYMAYCESVLGKSIDKGDDFNLAEMPEVVVKFEKPRRNQQASVTNEEVISAYQAGDVSNPKANFDLDGLKQLAASKGIPHHPNIGYDKLYAKIFEAA